jgi:alkylhydroperoxidase family enzyme
MHKKYGDKVEFVAIYVREAHPIEGWRIPSNDRAGISIAQPQKLADRVGVASTCSSRLEMDMPLLVDEMDDRVGQAYSGMPDRLYLIDRDGRVVYKGGRGPFGFKPGELEQSLIMLLLDAAPSIERTSHGFPILPDAAAWKQLPPAEKGGGGPLPLWARALAESLPDTTAAMLELDYLHRARSPLDPKLRAKMRWIAARANRCRYTEAYARADLQRAGLDEAGIEALQNNAGPWPPGEQAALVFARKMTDSANTVTDAEMAQLLGEYGNKQVVAMVLLLAHANFQDRLILSLGLPVEAGGPLPPHEIRFAKRTGVHNAAAVAPHSPAAPQVPAASAGVDARDWREVDFQSLQAEMEGQRDRQGRIVVPSWEEVSKHYPATARPPVPVRIRWSLVCMGYQPELASAWSACTRAFGREANQDRVFEECLFWVVTRTLHCFY